MAIEARHVDLFRPQVIQDRDMLNMMNQGRVIGGGGGGVYNNSPPQMHFLGFPESPENPAFYDFPAKPSVNADSGLTYNIPPPPPRKRSRDCYNSMHQTTSYAGEDMLPQIQQQSQLEINAIINWHTKKIRMELEQKQKQQAGMLAAVIGESVMRKLREKDEQIQRYEKINFVLQEKMRSLMVETQLWKDMAQSNEAAANSLRANLMEVLLNGGGGDVRVPAADGGVVAAAVGEEDAESCCGSSDDVEGAQDKEEGTSCFRDRKCKVCDEKEACVLLLPCRHLCLCSGCGSGPQQIQKCPVCDSSMNATLHVNMSY